MKLLQPRRRRRARGSALAAALVAAVLLLGAVSPAVAEGPTGATGAALHHAKHDLKRVKKHIVARKAKLQKVQRSLNRIATKISLNRSLIARTQLRMDKLATKIKALAAENAALEARLAERSRDAYILGPAAPMLYLLTATSAEDVVSRLGFLDEMSHRDELLALKVQGTSTRLAQARGELLRLAHIRDLAARRLAAGQRQLDRRLASSRRIYQALRQRRTDALFQISQIRPFAVCPVDGPVAVANDFGIWVNHGKEWGGRHRHQGNDMMAAMGTPIVAPFDGTAVDATNHIGGNAVIVYGQFGYVYNAHLSAFGQLGPVTKGTVIGYVGATGDAGGPHDHFEWHPNNGPAVDPHPFLMLVC